MENRARESQKKVDKFEELGIETIIDIEVKKFGTSGHIPISKKFIGRKVTIIVPKE